MTRVQRVMDGRSGALPSLSPSPPQFPLLARHAYSADVGDFTFTSGAPRLPPTSIPQEPFSRPGVTTLGRQG